MLRPDARMCPPPWGGTGLHLLFRTRWTSRSSMRGSGRSIPRARSRPRVTIKDGIITALDGDASADAGDRRARHGADPRPGRFAHPPVLGRGDRPRDRPHAPARRWTRCSRRWRTPRSSAAGCSPGAWTTTRRPRRSRSPRPSPASPRSCGSPICTPRSSPRARSSSPRSRGPREFPDHSEVVVDEHGAPTGELREFSAIDLVLKAAPGLRWPEHARPPRRAARSA